MRAITLRIETVVHCSESKTAELFSFSPNTYLKKECRPVAFELYHYGGTYKERREQRQSQHRESEIESSHTDDSPLANSNSVDI